MEGFQEKGSLSVSRVIFDIETIGVDFESLDSDFQEALTRWAQTEEEIQKAKDKLALSPLTGEIVTIAMLNPDTGRGGVFFQAPGQDIEPFEEDGIKFEPGDERFILERFWESIKYYDQFITFNGRSFDCPFIIIRSAIHRLKPTKQLLPNRYSGPHIDLLDRLTFFGATKRQSLEVFCKAFGIESPKAEGISGGDVQELFNQGRYIDIARYCLRDVVATKELLYFWETYIRVENSYEY
ncbi:MAG: 3'-5' exonuclease [Nitrospirae bacterium]|nr:MAG: 3'-5' exonuclease [Nitrospirota bacterium]